MLLIGMFVWGLGVAFLAADLVVNHRWHRRRWRGILLIGAGSILCYAAVITYPW